MPDSASARALVLERPHHLVIHDIPLPARRRRRRAWFGWRRAGCAEPTTSSTPANSRADSRSSPATRRSGSSKRSVRGPRSDGAWLRGIEWRSRFSSPVVTARHAWTGSTAGASAMALPTCTGSSPSTAHPDCGVDTPSINTWRRIRWLLPVPTALDPVVATVFNPLGAGIRWGATIPGTGPGDVVAVLGPGIRGLCAAAAARTPVPSS